MRFSFTCGLLLAAGLVAAQGTESTQSYTTYPPFDVSTSNPFPQHPPRTSTDSSETAAVTESPTTAGVVSTHGTAASPTGAASTATNTGSSSSSAFTVVSGSPSSSSSTPTPSPTGNSAMNVKAGVAMIIPGFAGVVAGMLL